MVSPESIDCAEKNLERAHGWVRTADQKAGFTLTISLALLGASLSLVGRATLVVAQCVRVGSSSWLLAPFLVGLFTAYVVFAVQAMSHLFGVVRPRTKPTTKRESLLYFGSIAKMDVATFKERMRALPVDTLLDEILDQTYVAAEIASAKHLGIQTAFAKLELAAVFGLSFLVTVSVTGALILAK